MLLERWQTVVDNAFQNKVLYFKKKCCQPNIIIFIEHVYRFNDLQHTPLLSIIVVAFYIPVIKKCVSLYVNEDKKFSRNFSGIINDKLLLSRLERSRIKRVIVEARRCTSPRVYGAASGVRLTGDTPLNWKYSELSFRVQSLFFFALDVIDQALVLFEVLFMLLLRFCIGFMRWNTSHSIGTKFTDFEFWHKYFRVY